MQPIGQPCGTGMHNATRYMKDTHYTTHQYTPHTHTLSLHTYTHYVSHQYTPASTHARTHARTHTHTHTLLCGRGTADCLFNLRRVVELARAHATPMHAAFVDFSKAFYLVNHEALWEVLEAQGIHPKLISLIKDLYEALGRAQLQSGLPYQWPGRKLSLGGAAQHDDAPLRG